MIEIVVVLVISFCCAIASSCISLAVAKMRRMPSGPDLTSSLKPIPPHWSQWFSNNQGGEPFEFLCPQGEMIPSVMFWALPGKKDTTNIFKENKNSISGLTAVCLNPVTGKTTISKRKSKDGYAKTHFGEIVYTPSKFQKAMEAVVSITEMIGRFAAAMVTYGASELVALPFDVARSVGKLDSQHFTGKRDPKTYYLVSAGGINKFRVAANSLGIQGLEFLGPGGVTSKFGGFDYYKDRRGDPQVTKTFECKKGTLLTGIKGRAGERINDLQFRCS